MPIYKVAKSLSDIESNVIVKMRYSENKKYIGIKTQNCVLFLATPYPDEKGVIQIIEDANSVPEDLLHKLDFEFGLVSTKTQNTNTR